MTREQIAHLVDRLENYIGFECEGGPLKLCVDWIQLKEFLFSPPVMHATEPPLGDWMCESHPGTEWPHGECAGPGMPWVVRGRANIEALTK
jgi:hypothetical protein